MPIVSTTDGGGDYVAHLDVGRYAVVVEPPVGVGLAQALVDIVDVCQQQQSALKPGKTSTAKVLDLKMPPPSVVVGQILDADQNPVSGVRVEIIAIGLDKLIKQADNKPPGTNNDQEKKPMPGGEKAKLVQETHLLGTTISDDQGYYELLVSPGQLATSDP